MATIAPGRPCFRISGAKALRRLSEVVSHVRLEHGGRDKLGASSVRPLRPQSKVEALASSLAVSQSADVGFDNNEAALHVLERLEPGLITQISSPVELEDVLSGKRDSIVILKCKAKYCRPCMAFRKKYMRLAAEFNDAVFLDVVGDESPELRKMMMKFGVKATPTFRIYKAEDLVGTVIGINEEKLATAIRDAGYPVKP